MSCILDILFLMTNFPLIIKTNYSGTEELFWFLVSWHKEPRNNQVTCSASILMELLLCPMAEAFFLWELRFRPIEPIVSGMGSRHFTSGPLDVIVRWAAPFSNIWLQDLWILAMGETQHVSIAGSERILYPEGYYLCSIECCHLSSTMNLQKAILLFYMPATSEGWETQEFYEN